MTEGGDGMGSGDVGFKIFLKVFFSRRLELCYTNSAKGRCSSAINLRELGIVLMLRLGTCFGIEGYGEA
jgi:hypothetical protein